MKFNLNIGIKMVCIISLLSICLIMMSNVNSSSGKLLLNNSTLDSLQGKWICENDSLLKWEINGRTLDERYNDEDSLKNHNTYTIYFSDTIISRFLANPFDEISVDTSALSGKYFVAISYSDSSVWCYEINKFYVSGTIVEKILVSDTWAKYTPTFFRRQ